MPLEQDQPITIARAGTSIGFPNRTGSHEQVGYEGRGTGEARVGDIARLQRPTNYPTVGGKKSRNGKPAPSTMATERRKFRLHWNEAQSAAEAMLQSAEARDLMGLGIAADRFDQSLAELWSLRETRDIDWKTILNHMQGMMRTFFLEKRAETLTADQCKRIVELVKDYLGPATKTIDDLNEVLRLIEDAGFDPYAAISADPGFNNKE